MTADEIRIAVQQRNALRQSVGLPQLVEKIEVERGLNIERDHQFEGAFAPNRHQFADTWTDPNEGWLSRSARWSSVKAQFRERLNLEEHEFPDEF